MRYATNYQESGGFITDRTHHKLRERNGLQATAECGATFHAEQKAYTDDEDDLRDRHKCGRCFD